MYTSSCHGMRNAMGTKFFTKIDMCNNWVINIMKIIWLIKWENVGVSWVNEKLVSWQKSNPQDDNYVRYLVLIYNLLIYDIESWLANDLLNYNF
jgi:hypothetical protein